MSMTRTSSLMLCLSLVVAFTTTAWATVTVDGVISTGEWEGTIINDGIDNAGSTEMSRWGVKVENNYLYWFCELGNGQTYNDFQGAAVAPTLLMDVDCNNSTYIGYDSPNENIVDDPTLLDKTGNPTELTTNHRGIDIALQCKLEGTWAPDTHWWMYGYGGNNGDCTSNPQAVAYDAGNNIVEWATWDADGSVIEASISIARLTSLVASLNHARDTTVGDYISLTVGITGGTLSGAIAPGLDVDTPIVITTDPVNKPLLSGDANLDGKVDGSDVTILAGNWQAGVGGINNTVTWRSGDFNSDGKVDGSDVTILAGNWQAGVSQATASVPEPGTLMLLLSAAFATLLFWYKR